MSHEEHQCSIKADSARKLTQGRRVFLGDQIEHGGTKDDAECMPDRMLFGDQIDETRIDGAAAAKNN